MKKKNLSLTKVISLLLDTRVEKYKKIIFSAAVLIYWIFPDLMPFLPIDDFLFTILAAWLFSRSAQKDIINYKKNLADDGEEIIDIEGYTIEDS